MIGSPGHADRLRAPEVRERQIKTLLDHNVRRRAADAERDDALEQHRQAVEGGVTIPTYQVATRSGPLRFRGTCPFCAGTTFDLDLPPMVLDRPHVSYRGTVLCLLCARTVAYLEIGTRMTAEQFRALPGHVKRGPKPRYSNDPREAARLRVQAARARQREMVTP